MTTYPTVYSGKGKMFYLVQHYEPWFSKETPFVVKSTLTYQLPMTKLCVSQWLTKKVDGVFIGNGVNLEKFKHYEINKRYDVMVMPRNIGLKGDYNSIIPALQNQGLKVLVVDKLSELELIQAYNSSKIFLYLSETEGFGYPPLEAMACGTAVVSTPCTEFLVDNQNAVVLPEKYQNSEVISKVKWLLENKGYQSALIEEGFKTAKELNFNKVVDRFEKAVV